MKRIALILVAVLAVALGILFYLGMRDEQHDQHGAPSTAAGDPAELAARGAYLARAGDCMACHTTRGGAEYAGGRAIRTPFGTIYSPNITPDEATGIGSWSADDFWRALHNGKSKDGTLLYPAFPYPNYTKVTRADSDALYAYFRTVTPVRQSSRDPALRFPFNYRPLLALWRALYFRPGVFEAEPTQTAEWNRGAYLVQGLGHCNACHTPRNMLGATESGSDLSGAKIPMLNWYAAALTGEGEAGIGRWDVHNIVNLLKTGVSERGAVFGPMAEVVQASLQHLSGNDIRAMATYLKSLPQSAPDTASAASGASENTPANQKVLALGASLYEKHCVDCHKASGAGAPPDYPPLAGNRSVVLASAVNPVRMVLLGGYPPSTQGNPRPHGMPPFGNMLNDQEVAAVVSFIRNNWGNRAAMVSPSEVNRYRSVPLE